MKPISSGKYTNLGAQLMSQLNSIILTDNIASYMRDQLRQDLWNGLEQSLSNQPLNFI